MARFSCFHAFVLSALVLFAVPVSAAQDGCSSQLYRGAAPAIKTEALAAQTHPICFSEIAVLYSGISRTPIWSAEHLTPARIESARNLTRPRSNAFHEEPRVPEEQRSELSDYRRSGFDRGHMAPNGDMSTPEAQEELFSLANMIPQDPCNNEVLWEGIEVRRPGHRAFGRRSLRCHRPCLSWFRAAKPQEPRPGSHPYLQGDLRTRSQCRRSVLRTQ